MGEGELCFSSALGLPWSCTGMIVEILIDLGVRNEACTICVQSWE